MLFGIIVFAFICTQDFSKAILQLRYPLKNYSEQNLAVKVIMPEIGDVSVKIFPPKYTKLAPYNGKDGGNVEALIGSNVCITAKANKPIEKSISNA